MAEVHTLSCFELDQSLKLASAVLLANPGRTDLITELNPALRALLDAHTVAHRDCVGRELGINPRPPWQPEPTGPPPVRRPSWWRRFRDFALNPD